MKRFNYKFIIRLLLFCFLTCITSLKSHAANLKSANVINVELFNSLPQIESTSIIHKLISVLPDEVLLYQRAKGGELVFVTDLTPYIENITFAENIDKKMICGIYQGATENIYVKLNMSDELYPEEITCIAHEYGHLLYHTLHNEWMHPMREYFQIMYYSNKGKNPHCYNEDETFAVKYSEYKYLQAIGTQRAYYGEKYQDIDQNMIDFFEKNEEMLLKKYNSMVEQ